MKKVYALLVTFLLVLILVNSAADVEVSGTSKDTTTDAKKVENSSKTNGGNDKIADPKTKGKDEVIGGGSKGKVGINTNEPYKGKSSKQLEAKEAGDKQNKAKDSGSGEVGDKVKQGSDSDSKKGTVPTVRKEGLRGEECDSSSNSCTIEEKALVACLRVPGNESPDLLLLIQNKGKETVSVSISAPSFVQLEKKQIQLKEKENNKVKVSIGKGGADDNTIILTAGTGKCTLDFKGLITRSSLEDDVSNSQFALTNFLKSKSSILFILITLFLIIASVGVFISFWRKNLAKKGPKYKKIDDVELPVSSDVKRVADSDDGWDNNWDDNWDDEEAPKMPSMPLTPSLSSKGITPRRTNKDGWND